MSENIDIQNLYQIIKSNDLDSFDLFLNAAPTIKNYKLGNLPLASVAILLGASDIATKLLAMFTQTNAFSEHDAPLDLLEKVENLTEDYKELYQDARFIEPSEIALLIDGNSELDRILRTIGIKTIQSRIRIEEILNKNNLYTLVKKGDVYQLKKRATEKEKRKKGFYLAILLGVLVSVMIPIIVLASMRVCVTFYDGDSMYGRENGLKGKNITMQSPEKEGYTFAGWYYDKQLTKKADGKLSNNDLYAAWQINSYTITFDMLDFVSENEFNLVNTATYGTKLVMPIPKVKDKLFLGWEDNGQLFIDNTFNKNVTLTPRFADFSNNSADNPFEIDDSQMLLYLTEQKGYFTFKDGLVFDKSYRSAGALSNLANGFCGTLLGQNRTVYYHAQTPIFLSIDEGGLVKDLIIRCDNNIALDSYSYDRFGILAGDNSGKIDTVYVTTINSSNPDNAVNIHSLKMIKYVGTVAGINAGEITNTTSSGYLNLSIATVYPFVSFAGGLVGANVGSMSNVFSFLTAKVEVWSGGYGGIVGYNTGLIYQAKNSADITVTGIAKTNEDVLLDCRVGGICANNTISKSEDGTTCTGEISAINMGQIKVKAISMVVYVGGIAGFSDAVIHASTNEQTGQVIIEKSENNSYMGGIVGFGFSREQGRITNSVNLATIDANNQGNACIGGIVGCALANNQDLKFNVTNCTNKGKVLNGKSVGGIAGGIKYAELEKCINAGEVSGELDCYLGGLVGEVNNSRIYKCFNSGEVLNGNSILCGIIDLLSGSSLNLAFGLSYSEKDIAYNDYNSSLDNDGYLIYHKENDPFSPILYPSKDCLVSDLTELPLYEMEGKITDGEFVFVDYRRKTTHIWYIINKDSYIAQNISDYLPNV